MRFLFIALFGFCVFPAWSQTGLEDITQEFMEKCQGDNISKSHCVKLSQYVTEAWYESTIENFSNRTDDAGNPLTRNEAGECVIPVSNNLKFDYKPADSEDHGN